MEKPPVDYDRVKAEYQVKAAVLMVPIFFLIVMMRSDARRGAAPASPALAVIAFVGMFTGAGLSIWNWRCPTCRRYLGKAFNPRFCQSCGAHLRD